MLREKKISENGDAKIDGYHLDVSIFEDAVHSLLCRFFQMTDQGKDVLMVEEGVEDTRK